MDGGGHAIGSGFCVCTFTGDHWELLEMLLKMSLINSIIIHHLVGKKFSADVRLRNRKSATVMKGWMRTLLMKMVDVIFTGLLHLYSCVTPF